MELGLAGKSAIITGASAGSFLDMDEQAFLDAWQLKLLGYIRMVKAVTPHMMERRDGRIINIVGGAGRTPNAKFLTGSTANAAILNFTRGISRELASYNVRINSISPGLPIRNGWSDSPNSMLWQTALA